MLMSMEDQTQEPSAAVRKPTAPATSSNAASPAPSRNTTAASTPAHSRAPTETISAIAEPPQPAATPVLSNISMAEAGGTVPPQRSASPSPIARTASPTILASSPADRSGNDGGLSALQDENASLREQLRERDLLIRNLELQLEQFKVNAKKARDALAE